MTEEEFDAEVATIRNRGAKPKHTRKRKRDATPEEWAARLEYQAQRLSCPLKYARQREHHATSSLWLNYGLTRAQFGGMLSGQRGVCAVCGEECATKSRLSVDHNHVTGEVRGLLCQACNTCAGYMKDSPERLRKLADYIDAGGTQAFDIVTFYKLSTETAHDNN